MEDDGAEFLSCIESADSFKSLPVSIGSSIQEIVLRSRSCQTQEVSSLTGSKLVKHIQFVLPPSMVAMADKDEIIEDDVRTDLEEHPMQSMHVAGASSSDPRMRDLIVEQKNLQSTVSDLVRSFQKITPVVERVGQTGMGMSAQPNMGMFGYGREPPNKYDSDCLPSRFEANRDNDRSSLCFGYDSSTTRRNECDPRVQPDYPRERSRARPIYDESQPPVRRDVSPEEESFRPPSVPMFSTKSFNWKSFPEDAKFSGCDVERFDEWINKFSLICHQAGCVLPADKALMLPLALKDKAQRVVMSVPGFMNMRYDQICNVLMKKFSGCCNEFSDKSKLRDRKKQKGENFQSLADDIMILSNRIFGAEKLADREAKEAFIKALPYEMRLNVASNMGSTLADCVASVQKYCAFLEIDEYEVVYGKAIKSVRFVEDKPISSTPVRQSSPSPRDDPMGQRPERPRSPSPARQYNRSGSRNQSPNGGGSRNNGQAPPPWNDGRSNYDDRARDDYQNDPYQGYDRSCWGCGGYGHFRRTCPYNPYDYMPDRRGPPRNSRPPPRQNYPRSGPYNSRFNSENRRGTQ